MIREIFTVSSIIEIFVLFLLFYAIFRFIKGTQAAAILKGLLMVLSLLFVGIMIITEIFELYRIKQMLEWILSLSVLVIIIVFAPEIRKGLVKIAQYTILSSSRQSQMFIKDIVTATLSLSKKKIGAIIAIEKEIGLLDYTENAIKLDAIVSPELIETIFFPNSPLHDGAVILKDNKILAASCILPLTENPNFLKSFGTRHCAAIGIAEITDAVVIVVSEETGKISVSSKNNLIENLDASSLEKLLRDLLLYPVESVPKAERVRLMKYE